MRGCCHKICVSNVQGMRLGFYWAWALHDPFDLAFAYRRSLSTGSATRVPIMPRPTPSKVCGKRLRSVRGACPGTSSFF